MCFDILFQIPRLQKTVSRCNICHYWSVWILIFEYCWICIHRYINLMTVAPDVTFRITACKQERVQARYPLWIWNPWGRTHEVQNRSNQWLHKMDLGPDKKFKKKKKKFNDCVNKSMFWIRIVGIFVSRLPGQLEGNRFNFNINGLLTNCIANKRACDAALFNEI